MMRDGHEEGGRPIKRRRLSMNGDESTRAKQESEGNDSVRQEAQDNEQEKDWAVGIRNFIASDLVTLSGVLKQRYTDFLVNEVLLDGKVLHLKSTKPPRQKEVRSKDVQSKPELNEEVDPPSSEQDQHSSEPKTQSEDQIDRSNGEQSANIPDAEREQLAEYLNETAAEEIIRLAQSIKTHPTKKSRDHPIVRTDFTTDRTLRSKIHQFIRQTFHSQIDSSTDQDGVLVLTAANPTTRRDRQNGIDRSQRLSKLSWSERGGEYLHFTLYKENKDTMEAISYLSRQLKCNAKAFQFAGTKDRRAVTAQRCSAFRVEAERLAAQNGSFRNSKVGDFEYRPRGLELGDLKGNEFLITLRNTSMSSTTGRTIVLNDLRKRMNSLRENGFINYYGHQRFGTFSVRTDIIGGHILHGNFQAACDAILHFSESSISPESTAAQNGDEEESDKASSRVGQDDLARAQAISQWRTTNNANKALDLLPRKFSAEAHLIRHLSRHPNDYFGALMLIQRNLRLMYVHAYQSYVWNFAASNRIKLYGTEVVVGDLVLVNEYKDKEQQSADQSDTKDDVDMDGDPILAPDDFDRATHPDEMFERARALTEADLAPGHLYTIFDIVLPQPGFDILYPANESGVFYETFMKSEAGGNLDPYNMRRKQRDFSLAGAYRKLVGRIEENWSIDLHRYERDDEQFVQTDWEAIMAKKNGDALPSVMKDRDEKDGEILEQEEAMTDKPDVEDKRKTAIVLKFQLGSSQYATMVLRELSKGGIRPYKPEFSSGR